jgi:type IV pilus assembly protein PilM
MVRRSRTKPVVGVEIEPGALTAARVSVNGRISVEQAASAPLEPNVVRDGEIVDPSAVAEALRELWRANEGLGKNVRVGVANARIVMRVMDLPAVDEPKELDAIVRFHAEQELPMPLDAAVLDHQVIGRVPTPEGERLRVVVVAARREMIERVVGAVRAAGLRLEGIDLSAFAMIRALRRDDEPTLYLCIGGTTNLAVADHRGCLFTRVTGGGLEAMVVALAERLSITPESARDYVMRAGFDGGGFDPEEDGEAVAATRTVLSAGVRQIAGEVRSSLDFHQSQSGDEAPIRRVVLTGPAVGVPGFEEVLCTELGLPVETRGVDVADRLRGRVDPARLAVAAGLAVTEAPA